MFAADPKLNFGHMIVEASSAVGQCRGEMTR